MIGFLGRRLLTLGLTLWLASLVVFVVLEVLPGDPALLMLGVDARPDTLAACAPRWGWTSRRRSVTSPGSVVC